MYKRQFQASWQASGPGSVLVLGVANIVSVPSYNLNVNALAGGQVLLASLVSLNDAVIVQADGTNSLVDLPQLVTATNVSFSAQSGGSVLALGLRTYRKETGSQANWQASGPGSVLLLGVTNIVSVPSYNLNVNAVAGGQVVLTRPTT